MYSKYVVYDYKEAVLLPMSMKHKIHKTYRTYRDTENPKGPEGRFDIRQATSAGFFNVYVNDKGEIDVAVHGKSESLDMSSRPEDADIIKLTLGIL
jgi:hypothetical protein